MSNRSFFFRLLRSYLPLLLFSGRDSRLLNRSSACSQFFALEPCVPLFFFSPLFFFCCLVTLFIFSILADCLALQGAVCRDLLISDFCLCPFSFLLLPASLTIIIIFFSSVHFFYAFFFFFPCWGPVKFQQELRCTHALSLSLSSPPCGKNWHRQTPSKNKAEDTFFSF